MKAIAKVQTQAGALSGQVQGLQRDSAALAGELERVDRQAGLAANTLAKYRTQAKAGRLGEQAYKDVGVLKDFIVQRGGDTGRAYVSQFERELGGGPPPTARRPRPAAMAAGPQGVPLPDTGPRALNPLERAAYLSRGDFTEDELNRARVLKRGTLYIRPAPRSSVAPPEGDGGPDLAPQAVQPPTVNPPQIARAAQAGGTGEPPDGEPPAPHQGGRGVPLVERSQRAAVRPTVADASGAIDANTESLRRRDAAQRAFALTERTLRVEWADTTRQLREQSSELARAEDRYRRLRSIEQDRGRLSSLAREDLTKLPRRMQQMAARFDDTLMRRTVLEEEARRRGHEVYGDHLFAPTQAGPGAFRSGASAFLTGAGLSGGSTGGTIAGMAVGLMRPAVALPLLAGQVAFGAINRGREAYGKYVDYLEGAERIGRVTDQTGVGLLDAAAGESRSSRTASLTELVAARAGLARGLGRTDFPDIATVASVTGRSPAEEAASVVALTRLAPRVDPTLSSRILAEFGASGAPQATRPTQADIRRREEVEVLRSAHANATDPDRRALLEGMIRDRKGPTGRRLKYTTALEGDFRTAVLRVAGAQSGPLTRVSPEGVAAQIGATSRLSVPGIDMSGPQAIDVGSAIAEGVNAHVGRPVRGSALDDIRTLAVMRLRGTPVAERLRQDFGIDINTVPGVLRAIERAPELATRGVPQIGRAMLRTERRAFGGNYEMALRADGTEGEMAHQLATQPINKLIGARPRGRETRLGAAADEISESPEISRIYEHSLRPQLREYETGAGVDAAGGVTADRRFNDVKDWISEIGVNLTQHVAEVLKETVARALSETGEGVVELLRREIDTPTSGRSQQ